MAVIIDVNCLANVFSKNSARHSEFEPVLNWILKGKGLMVVGGTKYNAELAKLNRFLVIVRLLKEIGKVHLGNDEEIDAYQLKVEELRDTADFDDPHLPAIVVDTKCRIICSEDTRSIPYVTNSKYYPKGFKVPVYYTSSRNSDLLCDRYVDDSFKPLEKINKKKADRISNHLK